MKYSLVFILALSSATPLIANAQDGYGGYDGYGSGQPQQVAPIQPEIAAGQEVPAAAPVDDAYSPATQILKEQAPNFPQEQVPLEVETLEAQPTAPEQVPAPPATEVTPPEPIAPEMIEGQKATLQILDKIDARVQNVDVEVEKEKSYHELKIEMKRCVRSPQESKEENMAFMRIWDVAQGDYTNIVFSGWMFSSNPALHSFEHPLYDIVLLKCFDDSEKKPEDKKKAEQFYQ